MMDAITLAIIKQFPRPCLACGCFLEQPLMTSREHKEKPTCQICGDYLCESCQDRTGVDQSEFNQTLAQSEFNPAEQDLYRDGTDKVKERADLTSICCSTCNMFLLDPIKTYLADGGDRTVGADSNVMKHVKRYREGQQAYPFAFKGTSSKEPSTDATNTGRILTGMAQIDEDEEAVVELEEDTETETAIKGLKGDIDCIKETVDKIVKDGKNKVIGLNKLKKTMQNQLTARDFNCLRSKN